MATIDAKRGNATSRSRSSSRLPWRTALLLVACFSIGAGVAVMLRHVDGIELSRVGALVDHMTTSAYTPSAPPDFSATVAPRAMPICGVGRGVDCVVDGDTIWLAGEKIRLVNIDAPEVKGRCRAETQRAAAATRALARLLDGQPIRIVRQGQDRYGRTLAAIATSAGDAGALLVSNGLAVSWRGRREPVGTWCGA
ncbi:thermonuclease family protein [Oricola indica]|uniref:thermonuclease family protein n=1 Tax=Oricola indica TaxID=2872591 RepID=UPI003CCC0753